MPLSHLEHFLVQTASIERTRDWYVRVLGFKEGWHPDFRFPVCWLYLGDRDVIHITAGGANVGENRRRYVGQESQATSGTGVIDHMAFRATGLRDMMDHLKREGVAFKQRQVSDQGLYQLFLFDPNDIKIELNFANAEALEHGITPELMASDLPG
jgi:catechol 2,3-dioxygenase-like lactoylglutathione lyase family enzyme